jgi:uncharacterized protein (TIGR02145 family)
MKISKKTSLLLTIFAFTFVTCKKKDPEPFTFTNANTLEAEVNEEIILSGSGMSVNALVKFGDVEATEKSGGGKTLRVKVPNGSVRGKISVSLGGTTFTSEQDFTTKNYLQRYTNLQGIETDFSINFVFSGSKVWFGRNLRGPSIVGQFTIPDFGPIPDLREAAYLTWDEAQNACPQGWRLPSQADYEEIAQVATSTPQESFNTLRNGAMRMEFTGYSFNNQLFSETNAGWYWTSTPWPPNQTAAGTVMFFSNAPNTSGPFAFIGASKQQYKLCIRCVKNL